MTYKHIVVLGALGKDSFALVLYSGEDSCSPVQESKCYRIDLFIYPRLLDQAGDDTDLRLHELLEKTQHFDDRWPSYYDKSVSALVNGTFAA